MNYRAALQNLVKATAKELSSARLSEDLLFTGERLAGAPAQLLGLVEMFFEETSKKRPRDAHVLAYECLLTEALGALRMGVESGKASMQATIDAVQAKIIESIDDDKATPTAILLIGQYFSRAKLGFNAHTAESLAEFLDSAQDESLPSLSDDGMEAMLTSLVADIGEDPYVLHDMISSQIAAFSPEQQAVIIENFADFKVKAMHEAAMGWLLDRRPAIGMAAFATVAGYLKKGALDAKMISRLTLMRNLVATPLREPIDQAIRLGRQKLKGELPQPTSVNIEQVIVSGCDGVGCQTIMALIKTGRTKMLVNVLLKRGVGVRDTMVHRDLSQANATKMLHMLDEETEMFPSSLDHLSRLVCDALAMNVASDTPPPFQLIQIFEELCLGVTVPKSMTLDDMTRLVLGDGYESDEVKLEAALRASRLWYNTYPTFESWYENTDAVNALLSKTRGKSKQIERFLGELMPNVRKDWADLLARMSMTIASKSGRDDPLIAQDRIDMALVAREMAGERALRSIPFAMELVERSVEFANASRIYVYR